MQAAAPVFSLVEEQQARAESAAWSRFAAAADEAEFCTGWLALLAGRIGHARGALLLTSDNEQGPFTVAAVWPDAQRDLTHLGVVAQRALVERQGVVAAPDGGEPRPDQPTHVGYPIEVGGRLHGAVVVDVAGSAAAELQAALRQIHWASGWLMDHFRQRLLRLREAELARVGLLNELMATALQHRRLAPSALAVANELAARLGCDRVSVGFEQDDRIVPLAMSHTATFDQRSDLVRALAAAMDEVLDLGAVVSFPVTAASQDALGAIAHADSAGTLGAAAMLSVPLTHEVHTIGVITLERRNGPPFDAEAQRLVAALGVMLGPVWALQRLGERSLWQRAREHLREGLRALFGPRHPGLKLIVTALALLVLGLALWTAEHRVSARTVIEGSTQIAAVAPFDGFVAESHARAGDTVRKGQVLAKLDDRDLLLERERWVAEREQLQRKFQVAMAAADRGAMGVLAAQAQQAEAQLALAEERLARAALVAPFDGVVVSGDLSRAIGTPVEHGRTLFEVAPLDGFRVVLQVDDRDISRVASGQRGELVLSSLPDRALPFTVSTVTPVATQVDGRNVFRVEAKVEGAPQHLRPGMEGVGKVLVGERNLLWIWTHRFADWLRLSFWAWTP
ncbi:MAG: HlyD family efflux transporter periplasmic adaptor subunit [Pseudomonadota bacterium]